jgi:hypothetical protein
MSSTSEPWEIFDASAPLLGARYGKANVRMVALGLRGGGLVVASPGTRVSDERFAELERHGEPRFLLAPNHFHNAGLALWKARYPRAQVVAHPTAHARLQKKLPELGPIGGLEALEAALHEGARVFGPPMAKQGETWLSVPTAEGRAWCVCDAVLNDPSISFAFRLLGFRPVLMTNPLFKRLFLKSKADYKRWMLGELERERPTLFIPSHGTVLRGDSVSSELRRVTEEA